MADILKGALCLAIERAQLGSEKAQRAIIDLYSLLCLLLLLLLSFSPSLHSSPPLPLLRSPPLLPSLPPLFLLTFDEVYSTDDVNEAAIFLTRK